MKLVDTTAEEFWEEERLPRIPDSHAPILKFPKDADTYIVVQNGVPIVLDRETALSLFKDLGSFLGIKVKV